MVLDHLLGNTESHEQLFPNRNNRNNVPNNQQIPTAQQYLASLPPGPIVNGQNAFALRDWLGTPMGSTVLKYFDSRTVQANGKPGLNLYNLTEPNFRLWLAIKIIADKDAGMYARSLAQDSNLFNELIRKRNTVWSTSTQSPLILYIFDHKDNDVLEISFF